MRIRDLPLDQQIIQLLEGEGLDQLYPPQEDAVHAEVLDGKNLVLASPTASGKTLIAELCILKHVLERQGKAIYLAPLRALASEKYGEFQKYSTIKKPSGERLRVGISTGDYDSSDQWLGRYDIILSTNEKADSLLRHKAPWMSELTLVVADEIHLLTEHERGPTLEVVLTRLAEINPKIQVLALSATVSNAEEVGQWLHAGSVTTEWRPVPLREGIYHEAQVQFSDGTSRNIPGQTNSPALDIALEVLSGGGQALIFTETRRSAVEMGRKAALALKGRLSKPEERVLQTLGNRILSTAERTRLSEALASQVASGAAFHHAGLPGSHRTIIEESFREGRIKILAATPTLAAGVNLPARAVVVSSYERYEPGYGRYPISVLEYKQFCLPHTTKVTLPEGSAVPIGDAVKQRVSHVLSLSNPHGLDARPVVEYFERKASEVVEVTTNIGKVLTATPEHPVLVRGPNDNPRWTPIRAISPGDLLAYAREIVPPNRAVYWLDYLPIDTTYVLTSPFLACRKPVPWSYKEMAEKLRVRPKTLQAYRSGRRNPPLRLVLELGNLLSLDKEAVAGQVTHIKSKWGKPVTIGPTLDESFMWLVGIVASDGHLRQSSTLERGTYYQVRVFNQDSRIVGKTVSILRNLGLQPHVSVRQKKHFAIEVGSNQLARMISQFGVPFRDKSLQLFVPDFMLSFPRHLIGAYLAGVFDGDGSYSEVRHPRGRKTMVRAIVIATGSEKFAWGLHELLLRLGVMNTVVKDARIQRVVIGNKERVFSNPVYRVTVRRIADIQRFRRWAKPVKIRIPLIEYSQYHNASERRVADANRPIAWVKALGVATKRLPKPIKVYNLSVSETETYLASGFVVHNCGRAGRPKYDKFGESLLIARNPDEAEWLMENYVLSRPEKLWSKLAVEKVLRPHVLSTIAAGYAHTEEGLYDFFGRTFYAHQYGPRLIKGKIGDILRFLVNEEMVSVEGKDLSPTKFGKRVSELYIDPESAVILRDGLYNRAKNLTEFSLLHLIAKTPDLAPRPRPRSSEAEKLSILAAQHSDEFTFETPEQFEDPVAYDDFLSELKATQVLLDWITEATEDEILESRKVEPGDLLRLVQGSEWLVFAAQELGRLFGHKDLLGPLEVLRVRVAKGVKHELVKLVGLEGVGRVRARMLYRAGLKTVEDLKERSLTDLMAIPTIGPSLAKKIKEQAGGLIKAEEWEKVKTMKPSEVEQQAMLTEYEDTT